MLFLPNRAGQHRGGWDLGASSWTSVQPPLWVVLRNPWGSDAPPQPLSKGAGRRSSGHPREGLAGTPLGCSALRLPAPFGKGWGEGIGPPGIPEHHPRRRLGRDPGTGSPVWIPLARTKTVSRLQKALKIQRFPTEIRPDHDITFPKCKHHFLCADEDRCFTENAKKYHVFLARTGNSVLAQKARATQRISAGIYLMEEGVLPGAHS